VTYDLDDDVDPLGDDPYRPAPDEHEPEPRRRCRGWASYDGPCGDCPACTPEDGE